MRFLCAAAEKKGSIWRGGPRKCYFVGFSFLSIRNVHNIHASNAITTYLTRSTVFLQVLNEIFDAIEIEK